MCRMQIYYAQLLNWPLAQWHLRRALEWKKIRCLYSFDSCQIPNQKKDVNIVYQRSFVVEVRSYYEKMKNVCAIMNYH